MDWDDASTNVYQATECQVKTKRWLAYFGPDLRSGLTYLATPARTCLRRNGGFSCSLFA